MNTKAHSSGINVQHPLLWASVITIAGVLLRLGYLAAPHIDSDQAIFGLQGMHVLKGEFPIFSWGFAYIGTLQTYLDAALFALFGPSRHTLNLAAVPFYLLYSGSLFAFARRVFSHDGWALAALALGALAPAFFMIHGIWGRHGYPETFGFGSLMLALMARNLQEDSPVAVVADAGLFFVFGLAWWSNFLILALALPVAVYFLYRLTTAGTLKQRLMLTTTGAGALVIGSLPFWIYNLQHGFESLALFSQPGKPPALMWEDIKTVVVEAMPVLVGARNFGFDAHLPLLGSVLSTVYWIAMGLFAVWAAGRAVLDMRRLTLTPLTLVWLALVNIFGVYLLGGYSATIELTSIRYLIPFYCIYPLLPVFLFLQLSKTRAGRLAGGFMFVFLLAMNAASYVADCPFFNQTAREKYQTEVNTAFQLAEILERKGIDTVAMHSYWQAPRMTFDVRERVVFAHVNSRYPPYLQTLFAKDQIHYLAARRDLGFEHGLKVLGLRFSSESINGYTLYNPFRFQSPAGRSVRFRQDLVVSTSETGAIPALSDSNGATFYRLRQSQCLNLELKSPTPLTGVLLTMANRLNVPQEIVIKDGETGLKLMKVNRFYPGYFIGEHPYLPYSPGHCEYRFPAHRTHRLQLCVARAVPMGWYALSEVGLFQRSDDSKTDASLKPFFQQHLAASEAVYSSPGAVVRLKQHDGFRRNRLWADSNKDKQVIFDRINLLVFESAYLEHNRRILAASGVKHRWAQGPVFAAIATTPAAGASALYWCGGRMLLTGKPPR